MPTRQPLPRWVKTWRRRLRAAAPEDTSVLLDRSHAATPRRRRSTPWSSNGSSQSVTPRTPAATCPRSENLCLLPRPGPRRRALNQPLPAPPACGSVLRSTTASRRLRTPPTALPRRLHAQLATRFKDPRCRHRPRRETPARGRNRNVDGGLLGDQQARPTQATRHRGREVQREGLQPVNVDRDHAVGSSCTRRPSSALGWAVERRDCRRRSSGNDAFVERLHRTLGDECLRV